MAYVAQLNAERICTSVAELLSLPPGPLFVPISSMDMSLLGRHHDGQEWGAAVVPSAVRHITQLAFLSRFSDAEAIAIDLASIGATQQAAAMRRYLNKVNAAKFIDLDRPDTRAGVQALEAATLLAPGRALVILDAEIQQHERA